MFTKREVIGLQAEHHPLIQIQQFTTLEEFCLYLIHCKAYEEAAKVAQNKIVLDLGCNNGFGADILSVAARKVIGADVSQRAIEAAHRAWSSKGVEFVLIDGIGLPFMDRCFEVIVSFQVIEHIADIQAYLYGIQRILAPEGVAIFTTPNACIRLDPGMKPWNEFHVHEFNAAELYDTLRQVFPRVEVRGLFAPNELYTVEFNRLQRARINARKSAKAILPPWRRVRSTCIDLVKAVVPAPVVNSVRQIIQRNTSGLPQPSPADSLGTLDPAVYTRYST